jgi:hypothetical protein
MTKLSELTLEQFFAKKASAQELILTTIAWLEESTGVPVVCLRLDRDGEDSFLCDFVFEEPFAKQDEAEEEKPEAE